MKKQIFTYWEGVVYPYIEYCLETIKANSGVDVTVLTPKNVDEYLCDTLHVNWRKFTDIAQKVDCIRVGVMYSNGGMWCDADTIFLKPCGHLFNKDSDFIGMRWSHNWKFNNGYWFCKKKSKFMKLCLDKINTDLSENFKKYYESLSGCHFGEDLFNDVAESGKVSVESIPLETCLPVNFPFKPTIWNDDSDIDDWVSNDTVAIGLNNSHFSDQIKGSSVAGIARKRNLLGSAFRYSGINVDIEKSFVPTGLDLSKIGLPQDFGPEHEDWKIPSKRQRYQILKENMSLITDPIISVPPEEVSKDPGVDSKDKEYRMKKRDLSKMEFSGNFAIMTVCSGEYQWFAPMFNYMIRKNIPEATPLVYIHGKGVLPEKFESDTYRSSRIDLCPVNPYRTAAMRFVFSDDVVEKFDYVLITDVDIMISKENVSIVTQHVRSMLAEDTVCYDNYNQAGFSECVMPGVHFVSKQWWKETAAARQRHEMLLRSEATVVENGYDEAMLGKIVVESGLKTPTRDQHLWCTHGVHLGDYRGSRLRSFQLRGMSALESIVLKEMFDDKTFVNIANECSKNVPWLGKIIGGLRELL